MILASLCEKQRVVLRGESTFSSSEISSLWMFDSEYKRLLFHFHLLSYYFLSSFLLSPHLSNCLSFAPPPSFSLEEIDRINWQYMETNVQNSSKVSKIVKVNINHAYNETDIYSEIGPSIQWINQIHRFQWLRKIIYNGSWKIPMNTHYCRWSR